MGYYMVDYDAEITIEFGGIQDGTPNWPANATSIKGIARSVTIEESANEIEMSAIADLVATYRYGKSSFRIEIEQMIASTGYFYRAQDGTGLLRHYVRVSVKPNSSLANFHQYIGLINSWTAEIRGNEVQIERCRIIGVAA